MHGLQRILLISCSFWSWSWFAIGYLCAFAYVVGLIVYQLVLLFTGGTQIVGLVIALALLACILFQLFRPYKEAQKLTVE